MLHLIVLSYAGCTTQKEGCFTGEQIPTEVSLDDTSIGFSANDVGALVSAAAFGTAEWLDGGQTVSASLAISGPTAAVVQTRDWSGEEGSENPRCVWPYEAALHVGFDLELNLDDGGIVAAGPVRVIVWGEADPAEQSLWGYSVSLQGIADPSDPSFPGNAQSVVPAELDAAWAAEVDAAVDPSFTPDGYAIGWAGTIAEPYALLGIYAWSEPDNISFANADRAFLQP